MTLDLKKILRFDTKSTCNKRKKLTNWTSNLKKKLYTKPKDIIKSEKYLQNGEKTSKPYI